MRLLCLLPALLAAVAPSAALGQADLIVRRASVDTMRAGYDARVVVVVKNLGPQPAAAVVVRWRVSGQAVALRASRGAMVSAAGVEWPATTLAPQDSAVDTVTVRPYGAAGFTDSAWVADPADPDPSNNSAEGTVVVKEEPLSDFNSLRTPSSPAFVLLGVEPTAVERPNTPSGLALSVLNSTDGLSAIPRDYALEVSPYWLFGHPSLTWQEDAHRALLESVVRTATLSFATAQIGDSGRPVTGVSLGLRASLASGTLAPAARARLEAIKKALEGQSEASLRAFNELLTLADSLFKRAMKSVEGDTTPRADSVREAAITEFARKKSMLNDATRANEEVTRRRAVTDSLEIPDLASNRQGLSWEIALGWAWEAARGVADSLEYTGAGAWTTISWTAREVSAALVARYLSSGADTAVGRMDLGARFIFTKDRLAISAEAASRVFLEDPAPKNQFRYSAVAEFEVSGGLWAQFVLGKDYDGAAAESLMARLGLSLNLARKGHEPIP